MSQQTFVNGNRYSFVDISVFIGDFAQPRGIFKSINYDSQQDPGIVQGNQVGIVGRTAGYGTATGSFEMLRSEMDDLFFAITQGGAFPIHNCPDFTISVTYSVNEIDTVTDELRGCRITKIGSSNSQGTDATTKSCDLQIAQLILGGLDAFSDFGQP